MYAPPGGPGTRVDSHCYPGWTIAPFYDSLIAKLIVWGNDRDHAIDRMDRALSEFRVEGRGVKTTIPFHRRVLQRPGLPLGRRDDGLRRAVPRGRDGRGLAVGGPAAGRGVQLARAG